jgi:hypothetical protein
MRLALFSLVMLAGCAGVDKALEYDDTVHKVSMADDTYRVFEHPNKDRIMVTPSLETGLGAGFVQGATLGLVDAMTPEQKMEAAARKHLNDTGRSSCTLGNGYEILKGQYEFRITC